MQLYRRTARRSSRRLVRVSALSCAFSVAVTLTAGAAQAMPAPNPRGLAAPPPIPAEKQIPYTWQAPGKARALPSFPKFNPAVDSHLPGAGAATVDLSAAPAAPKADGAVRSTNQHAATLSLKRAGTLPVLVGLPAAAGANSAAPAGPSRVSVTLTDQKSAQAAGIHGILFTLAATPGSTGTGPLTVSVDDSTFLAAFGGDYAARLHLVRLPACALTTPQLAACQAQSPLAPLGRDALSARIDLSTRTAATSHTSVAAHPIQAASPAAVVLGLTSGPSGPSGTYAATPLSPAGTWSTSGNTGSFDYSYPIHVPAAIAGGAPNVDLSYDSSSQDGRTEGTNNQSSWLGDGWDSTESYIERSYESCSDNTSSGAPQYSGDECWAGQVLTLSLNGQSTQIVWDATAKTFRPVNDASTTKIEQLTNCTNGTYNNECWRVTENGTQYYFGLNQLPGYTGATGQATTQSAWSVPVYCGPDAPACTSSTFATSSKLMGWRWNLDYVVDPHANAAAYYYSAEYNNYGADMQTTPVKYTRGGYLTRIDYGMTASTIYSGTAPEQIVFTTAERCIPGQPSGNTCADAQFTVANAAYWPDVPIDQDCWTINTSSCPNHGPSFWSRKRLTSIVTQIQVSGATKAADEYDFTQAYPDGGDHAPTLWLDSIKHTGLDETAGATATVSDLPVSFDPPQQLPNRVATLPSIPVMYHDRIQNIQTEAGAKITVTYNPATCTPSNVPSDPSTNTMPCFPVYWTPYGATAPELDWFQKYTVHQVETQDQHDENPDGSYPDLLTTYQYDGGAAWHYDDNEVVKSKNRTYGQFRGYATVEILTGNPSVFHLTNGVKVYDQQSLTKTTYLRGMDSDTPSGTGGTAVTVASLDGKYSVKDANALAGQVFETDTYTDATGTTLQSAAVNVPTIIGPTATRNRTGLPPLTAQMVRTANTYTRTAVSYSPGWRYTETDTFYNTTLGKATTGNPIQVDDRGEVADPHNIPKCTWTRYVESADGTLVLPAEVITNAQDCTTAGATPTGPLISDARSSYDGNAFTWDGASPAGTAPTKGDVTATAQAVGPTGPVTAAAFVTLATSNYDSYGRVVSVTRTPNSTAPNGGSLAQAITTSYTPASGSLPAQVQTQTQVAPGASMNPCTSPACQTTTTTVDPVRGLTTEKIDAAGLKTDYSYDALGRVTAVWLPNQAKSAGQAANYTYAYTLSQSAPEVVATNRLLENGTYATSETLYDSMLRTRETQQTSENSTIVVSDTQYNSLGKPVLTENAYNVTGTPSAVLVTNVPQSSIPDATVTDYDALARSDLATEEHDGVASWTTTTAYAGDHTTVIPPTGGVAQTTYTDARGQTSELDQYTAAPTLTGTTQSGFTVTGGSTNHTTYTYTTAGKQASVTGPDGKIWSSTYDLTGRKTQQTDPDAGTSTSGYDDAGNQVSTTDARGIELDYTYDLLGRKLTATDKHLGGFEYASWLYDTLQVGKPTSSTRYVQGTTGGYTVAVAGYTSLGKPGGTTITLPSSESPLPTTYTTRYSYSVTDQLLNGQSDPRVGSLLLGEALSYTYDPLGAPTATTSGLNTYVTGTVYTPYGEPSRMTLGPSTNPAYLTYTYDDQTRRLTDVLTTRTQAPGPTVDDTSYTYDPAGKPTSTTDQQSETGTTLADTQCYQYNALDELTQAWTDTAGVNPAGVGAVGGCKTTTPSSATLATGPAGYWQSYGYDAIGDRNTETDHTATTATTTTYTNGGTPAASCTNTAIQPHTLTSISTGTSSTSFCYDALGDTLSRTPTTGTAQTLAWDDEGHLQSVTQGSNTTSYLYDADGNQLLRRDPGQSTLFAGDTEIIVNTSVTPHTLLGAVRSYSIGGTGPVIAVRSSLPGKSGVDYQLSDPHGTATLQMDATTQAVSRTQYTPYGQVRGTTSSTWIDPTHGYLGQPADTTTGYTDLGARKYDPTLGRFISIDPVLEVGDPEQLGGYTYAADNPVTGADPSGLDPCEYGGCSSPPYPGYNGGPSCEGNCGGDQKTQDLAALAKEKEKAAAINRQTSALKNFLNELKHCQDDAGFGTVNCEQGALTSYELMDGEISLGDVWAQLLGGLPLAFLAGGEDDPVDDTTVGDESATSLLEKDFGKLIANNDTVDAFVSGAISDLEGEQTQVNTAVKVTQNAIACANSFTGDTPVLMADGTTKPISQIHVGDKISNAQPGAPFGTKNETHVVTAVHITYTDHDYTAVSVSSVHGAPTATGSNDLGDALAPAIETATITGTAHHLYWDATTRTWTEADRLRAGDLLQTDDGRTVAIVAVRSYTATAVTYNLTIDNLHTYYVEAGSTPVLVHNSAPCEMAQAIAKHSRERLAAGAKDHFVAGISSESDLSQYVDDILFGERSSISKPLADGRTAYWDASKGAVVIENPLASEVPFGQTAEYGTVFTPADGIDYYNGLK